MKQDNKTFLMSKTGQKLLWTINVVAFLTGFTFLYALPWYEKNKIARAELLEQRQRFQQEDNARAERLAIDKVTEEIMRGETSLDNHDRNAAAFLVYYREYGGSLSR